MKSTGFAKMMLAKKYPNKIKLGSQETDKGVLQFPDADELAQGVEVFVEDTEGNFILPDDGEYAYDGKIAIVENGVVVEIKEGSEEDLEDEPAGDVSELKEEMDIVVDVVKDLVDIVESMGEEVTSVSEELSKVKAENVSLREIINKAKLSSVREFEKTSKSTKQGKVESKQNLSYQDRAKAAREFLESCGVKS